VNPWAGEVDHKVQPPGARNRRLGTLESSERTVGANRKTERRGEEAKAQGLKRVNTYDDSKEHGQYVINDFHA